MRTGAQRMVRNGAAVVLLTFAGSACSDRLIGPGVARGMEGYRVFEEFVVLTPVADRVVVEFVEDISPAEAMRRLSRRGLAADSAVLLQQAEGYFEVWLTRGGIGTTARSRESLLRFARQVPGLRFITPVYRGEDGFEIRPLNLLTVQVEPGLSNRAVGELFARHGLEQVVLPAWADGMWHARFRGVVDAFGATNVVYSDPVVRWADLNAISAGRFQPF